MLCYSTVYWLQCLIELIFGMETLLNYNPKTYTLCYKIRICQISRISLYFPTYKRRKFSHGTSIVATCCQRSPTNVNAECDSQSNWCANPVTSIVVNVSARWRTCKLYCVMCCVFWQVNMVKSTQRH